MRFTWAVVEVGKDDFTQRYVCESKQHMERLFTALGLVGGMNTELFMEVTTIDMHLRTSHKWTGIILPFRELVELT